MANAPGDVWEVAIPIYNGHADPPTTAIVTWHFIAGTVYAGAQDLAFAVRDAWPNVQDLLSDQCEVQGVYARRVLPTPGPQSCVPFSPALQGGSLFPSHPSAIAVEVLRRSGGFGRSNWGRFYLPWTPVTWDIPDTTNQINPLQIAALLGALGAFGTAMAAPTSSSTSWSAVVYSHRSATQATHTSPVTSYAVMPDYRVQGRRGRRHDADVPFVCSVVGTPEVFTDFQGPAHGILDPVGTDTRAWRGMTLTLGEGSGNSDPPAGWSEPGFGESDWGNPPSLTQVLIRITAHHLGWPWPTADIAGPSGLHDFGNANFCTKPIHSVPFPPTPPSQYFYKDEHILMRRQFLLGDGQVIYAAIQYVAIDFVEIWLNGVQLVDDPSTTVTAPNPPTLLYGFADVLIPNALNCLGIILKCNNPAGPHGQRGIDYDGDAHFVGPMNPGVGAELLIIQTIVA